MALDPYQLSKALASDFKKADTALFRNDFPCYLNRCGVHPYAAVVTRGRRLFTPMHIRLSKCHRLNNAFNVDFGRINDIIHMKTISLNF